MATTKTWEQLQVLLKKSFLMSKKKDESLSENLTYIAMHNIFP